MANKSQTKTKPVAAMIARYARTHQLGCIVVKTVYDNKWEAYQQLERDSHLSEQCFVIGTNADASIVRMAAFGEQLERRAWEEMKTQLIQQAGIYLQDEAVSGRVHWLTASR